MKLLLTDTRGSTTFSQTQDTAMETQDARRKKKIGAGIDALDDRAAILAAKKEIALA